MLQQQLLPLDALLRLLASHKGGVLLMEVLFCVCLSIIVNSRCIFSGLHTRYCTSCVQTGGLCCSHVVRQTRHLALLMHLQRRLCARQCDLVGS